MKYGKIHKRLIGVSALSPIELLQRIKDEEMPFLLDSALGDKCLGKKSYLSCNPRLVFRSKGERVIITGDREEILTTDDPLGTLRSLLREYASEKTELPGLCGGAVGHISYDFASYNMGVTFSNPSPVELPDLAFGIYTSVVEYDIETNVYRIFYQDEGEVEFWETVLSRDYAVEEFSPTSLNPSPISVREEDEREQYGRAFNKIRSEIRKGNVYEVNLTRLFESSSREDAYPLYCRLREKNPADFMAYMDFGKYQILSSSPERFFELRSGLVVTRPIKGTIARGRTAIEDEERKRELLSSEKDISELLMIVDLMRNDLSRSCVAESVRVDEVYRLETYAKVHHLVSTIEGRLREDEDGFSLMRHLFPGGSITGAPKRAAVEVIEEVEHFSRGVYTGAIGYFSLGGDADFNILIRTILREDDHCYYYGGGAITWDSEMTNEYEEVLAKCAPIAGLFDTKKRDE